MGTPGVDTSKTKSNHVSWKSLKTLGIEAARLSIITEIQETMRSRGMSIDARHMMLLADVMTYKVRIILIFQYMFILYPPCNFSFFNLSARSGCNMFLAWLFPTG